jgi:hypothetical protein
MDPDHNHMDFDGESIFHREEKGPYLPEWTEELRQEKKEGWARREQILMFPNNLGGN